MRTDGFVQMHDVLPPEVARALNREYAERYLHLSSAELAERCLEVGERRYLVTVDISGSFNDPRVYANPSVFPIVDAVLGGDAVLDSFGVVCALPHAPAQHVHVDHPGLPMFDDDESQLPCYAVTVVLPLVDLDDPSVGSTAVWLGSHQQPWDEKRDDSRRYIPRGKLGSAFLWDYRVAHGGTVHESDAPRPILYFVYTRSWFNDVVNFRKQPKLVISDDELSKVPEDLRRLFARRVATVG